MASEKPHQLVEELLNLAGIQINGSNPWDIQIHNESIPARTTSRLGNGISRGKILRSG